MNYFPIVFLFLAHTVLFAQENQIPGKIEWGQEFVEPGNSYLSKIITQNQNEFFVLREQSRGNMVTGKPKIYLERFDSNLRLKQSEKIDLKYKNKTLNFNDVVYFGGELYLLTSFHNQKHKLNYLFAQAVTPRLRVSDKLIKIGEIPTRSVMNEGQFDYHISKDSTKILIYNALPYDKGDPERFALNIFDTNFNPVWNKDIALPYNDEQFEVEEYRVDDNGNVYILGITYLDGKRPIFRNNRNYQYTILAYTENGEKFTEYKIPSTKQFITDLTFRVGNDGNLVCSGFYSEKGTYSVKGTYFFRINATTQEIFNENYKEFSLPFLTEHLNSRQKVRALNAEREGNVKKQAELYQYALDELILRSDGGALLIAEQFYIEQRQTNPYGVGFQTAGRFRDFDYYYYYNDIIVVNINPDGSIAWTSRIPKQQVTRNDGGYYSSYARSIVRDRIFFVYNDNRRNFNPDKNRIYGFDGRNSIITLTEVLQDGSTNTYPLYNNRDADILTRPKVCKQSGKKEMLIYGEIGRDYRFAKLKF